MKYLIAEASLLDNAHTDVQHVFHQLLASAGFAVMLLFICTSADDSPAEDIQVLGFNCNTDNLAIALLNEALLEQTLDHGLQLALNTSFEDKRDFDILDASFFRDSTVRSRPFLSRQQRL